MFQKNIRIVYLYIVSLITLVMVMIGFIWTMSSFANMVWSENYSYNYKYDYPTTYNESATINDNEKANELSIEQNLDYSKMQEQNQRNQRIKSLINAGTFTIISFIVFIVHFKRAEKEYLASK